MAGKEGGWPVIACKVWLAYYAVKVVILEKCLNWPPPERPKIYATVAELSDRISKGKEFSSREEELVFKALYLRDAHQMLKDNHWK